MEVVIMPVVIGALGTVSEKLGKKTGRNGNQRKS